jgi:UDP-glucose 4-epimerase
VSERVLVTGGAGFIGRHLAEALHQAGMDVTILDDLSSGDPSGLPSAIDVVVLDISDATSADTIARLRPNLIVHAAAQISVARSMAEPERDRAVNLIGTANVIAGARRAGSRRLVFTSSGGAIYGDAERAAEDALPAPRSFYGVHKLAAEGYIALSGLPYAIARLSNVYGPGQRPDGDGGVIAVFLDRLLRGDGIVIHGSGSQTRDFVSVFDVVAALTALLATDRSGTWNVATGQESSIASLVERLTGVLGRPATLIHEPSRPGDVARSCLAIDAIERDLGWRPTWSLQAGLEDLVRRTDRGG